MQLLCHDGRVGEPDRLEVAERSMVGLERFELSTFRLRRTLYQLGKLVGLERFELSTSSTRTRRSTKLSHSPTFSFPQVAGTQGPPPGNREDYYARLGAIGKDFPRKLRCHGQDLNATAAP